jgi:hypothetical protein
MGKNRKRMGIWLESQKKRGNWGDLNVDGRIILRWNLKICNGG